MRRHQDGQPLPSQIDMASAIEADVFFTALLRSSMMLASSSNSKG